MAKQIHNFERMWCNRNKREKVFGKAQWNEMKCPYVSKNSNKMVGNSKFKA